MPPEAIVIVEWGVSVMTDNPFKDFVDDLVKALEEQAIANAKIKALAEEAVSKAEAIPKEQCQHNWFQYWHDCDSDALCGVDECSLCGYAITDCGLVIEAIPKAECPHSSMITHNEQGETTCLECGELNV